MVSTLRLYLSLSICGTTSSKNVVRVPSVRRAIKGKLILPGSWDGVSGDLPGVVLGNGGAWSDIQCTIVSVHGSSVGT